MARKEEENAPPAALSLSFNKVLEEDIDARNEDEFEGNIAETLEEEEEEEEEEEGAGECARGSGDIVPAQKKNQTEISNFIFLLGGAGC